MNPRTDNVTENHSTNIKIYYLTNSGRRAQINATIGSYQFDAFYSRHSQQTQQYPKDRCGRRSEQTTGSSKRRKEKDSFQFHFCMLMLPFKRMQNVSFIFRIPKDFKIKPYLCIRFGDVSTFRICIKGNSVIESEAVPATVKPVNEKQLSPCHCFLCKKWEGAFQGEARKPARSEHR